MNEKTSDRRLFLQPTGSLKKPTFLQKGTYTYNSLQFLTEINTFEIFILFHTIYDYRSRLSIKVSMKQKLQ